MKELAASALSRGKKVKRVSSALRSTVYLLIKGNFLLFTPRKRSEVALRSWSRVTLTSTLRLVAGSFLL